MTDGNEIVASLSFLAELWILMGPIIAEKDNSISKILSFMPERRRRSQDPPSNLAKRSIHLSPVSTNFQPVLHTVIWKPQAEVGLY